METNVNIDFDEIDEWKEYMNLALMNHIDKNIRQVISAFTPQYIEDVCDLLFRLVNREKIINATLIWLSSINIIGYHSSRLTNDEVLAVQEDGLVPLNAENRKRRLARVLSKHFRWLEIETKLEKVIQKFGKECYNGKREGQVHLTLSKAGLTNSFSHYLYYGAEFDQRVVFDLLGNEGKKLLRQDGVPRIIQVSVPGSLAITASNPYFSIDCLSKKGDIPNIVKEFITAWALKINNASFQSRVLQVDCGIIFFERIPASWISNIETISDLGVPE